MINFSKIKFPLGMFTAALLLRLVPVLLTRSLGIGLDDMFQYDMLARSIASGNGYRWYTEADLDKLKPYVDFDLTNISYDPVRGVETSFRAPLYPYFLSAIYWLVSSGASRFFAARLVQSILGAALVPLTYYISKMLIPGNERAARISSFVIMFYPILIVYPLGLGTENLFFFLLLASFLSLLSIQNNISAAKYIFVGFLLGLTALTRSVILLFAGFSICWIWIVLKQKRGALLTLTVLILTISPWIIRNSILHKRITGIESSMGYNLYLGYHPDGNGSFVFGPSLDLLTIIDDAERDKVGIEKAIEFISAEPERFIPLVINRLGYFWGLEKRVLIYFYSNNILGNLPSPVLILLLVIMLLPFVVICLAGTLSIPLLHTNPGIKLLGILVVLYMLPHIFILSEDRFHLALVPFIIIISSLYWTEGFNAIKVSWHQSRAGKKLVYFSALVILLLLFNWGFELFRDGSKMLQILGPNGNISYFPY